MKEGLISFLSPILITRGRTLRELKVYIKILCVLTFSSLLLGMIGNRLAYSSRVVVKEGCLPVDLCEVGKRWDLFGCTKITSKSRPFLAGSRSGIYF